MRLFRKKLKKFIDKNASKDVFTAIRVRYRSTLPPADPNTNHSQTNEDPREDINHAINIIDPNNEEYNLPCGIPFEEEKPR